MTERSISRDARGRVVDIDPVEGAKEWRSTKSRLSHAELKGKRTAASATGPASPAEEERAAAAVTRRLAELVAELQADTLEHVVRYLPDVLEGAAEAIQAAGRPGTAAEIAKALRLDEGLDGTVLMLSAAMLEAVGSTDLEHESIRELARAEGREAVLGYPRIFKEASDGDEG
ncbi:hypothetical protein [Anaeromyxobacter terrae]|uniref:hypothetical protein n=1 Tax=Anaeromyxobacter terrae TaxID=2925406 RepID=UPI001F57174C|nr:hypothetical protein [Anaeromyxobacter sp. SG22]